MNGTTTLDWRAEWRPLALLAGLFLALFFLPVGYPRFDRAVLEGLLLAKSYAREHVLLCLIPAFFIAGAIAVFVSDMAVMRYLGRGAHKLLAYGVASVSGTLLAVCSCTVLPLFASIYRRGAGLGPATAFLYSGPASNVLAITLTGSVLGWRLGLARAVGAVLFAAVVGLAMAFVFRRDDEAAATGLVVPEGEPSRPLWQSGVLFGALAAILVFANWARPQSGESDGLWMTLFEWKWAATGVAAAGLAVLLVAWFGIARWKVALGALAVAVPALLVPTHPQVAFAAGAVALSLMIAREGGEAGAWFESSWGFAKQILPPKCRQLTAATEEAAKNLGLDYELEKVEDLDSIIAFGVLRTPALAVDGTVKLSGRVPSVADIERLLG